MPEATWTQIANRHGITGEPYTTTYTADTAGTFATNRYTIDPEYLTQWMDTVNATNQMNNLRGTYGRGALADAILTDSCVKEAIKDSIKELLEGYLSRMYKVVTEHVALDISEEEFMAIMNGK